jgi:signal transduction histidine kinase
MNVDIAALARGGADDGLGDIRQLIDQAIAETRTLSHLLHPPSLDTSGLASAATWYVEGFGKRSGIKTSLNIPENLNRLPESVETALFRIMQEALTNVHRHSGSGAVEITLTVNDTVATLVVRDFGKGIPQDVLQGFTNSGTNVGVGLAGIRERVKELGGGLEIRSSAAGTVVQAAIPISGACSAVVSVDPGPRIFSALVS